MAERGFELPEPPRTEALIRLWADAAMPTSFPPGWSWPPVPPTFLTTPEIRRNDPDDACHRTAAPIWAFGLFFRRWNLSLDLQAGYGNTHGYATIAVTHHLDWDEP